MKIMSETKAAVVESFHTVLAGHGLDLTRESVQTLQINVGLRCNQFCRHCHLDAGPERQEMMSRGTVDEVIRFAQRFRFTVIDVTGGAPELNPHLPHLINELAPLTPRLMLRSNLTALTEGRRESLLIDLVRHRAVIVASLPSTNEAQLEAQRGVGIFQRSLATLRRLNTLGYGQPDSGLELNLVANPTGAFLASPQVQTEKRFRETLEKRWGITFNQLYTFTNVPLGRFREWLERTGNLESYLQKLVGAFNPCAVQGLMCRTLLSVSWDGCLFDCDFNLARGLFMGGRKQHVTELVELLASGLPIAVSNHCFACTAGAGFT
jgi:radical SAM/Cys-rich protein